MFWMTNFGLPGRYSGSTCDAILEKVSYPPPGAKPTTNAIVLPSNETCGRVGSLSEAVAAEVGVRVGIGRAVAVGVGSSSSAPMSVFGVEVGATRVVGVGVGSARPQAERMRKQRRKTA